MRQNLYQRLDLSTNHFLTVSVTLVLMIVISSCNQHKEASSSQEIEEIIIIPAPSKILYKRNFFRLEKSTRILLNLSDEKSKKTGDELIKLIQSKTGYKLKIADLYTTNKIESAIEIQVENKNKKNPAGFRVSISGNRIKLYSNGLNGLSYASDVILELLSKTDNHWQTAQVIIEDDPSTALRGIYLNVKDSTLDKSKLLKLLKINRINYLITSEKWSGLSNSYLQIDHTSKLLDDWRQYLEVEQHIKDFYISQNGIKDSIIFEISNVSLLHPDSLSVLGEALWSNPKNLNYQNLKNHLESKSNL